MGFGDVRTGFSQRWVAAERWPTIGMFLLFVPLFKSDFKKIPYFFIPSKSWTVTWYTKRVIYEVGKMLRMVGDNNG